jgi:LysR family transcriptional regulator, mexEF-oprN operon transcriptional activator
MENDFRNLDLNLLVVFNVLMREKSVSRAAEALYLGQPAISNSLSRLRALLEDDLFVRASGEMVPTTKASELHKTIFPALQSIHASIFAPQEFNPLTDHRTFTLGMRDWVEAWLMPLLLEKLSEVAPNVRIRVQVADDSFTESLLENDQIDFAITNSLTGPKWMIHQTLANMDYVAVYDGKATELKYPLSLEEFISVPHLMTSTKGAFKGAVDEVLNELNLHREVIYTTTRFNALPQILKQIKAIATLPEPVARTWETTYNLTASKLPFALKQYSLTLTHHEKNSNDQAFLWMKQLIKAISCNTTS